MDENYQIPQCSENGLDEISESIWSERATVMIGSGFSKNVESINYK